MLRLRLQNPIPDELEHHAPFPSLNPEFPLKPMVERGTTREFQIISLPQKDGTFVASVVEAPEILVYDRSRKSAEERAASKFLKRPDPQAFLRHPLATTKAITVEMEYDAEAKAFVTYVKEFQRISTFGDTESEALDSTAEMIRGYLRSMKAHRKRIPLSAAKLAELERAVGLD